VTPREAAFLVSVGRLTVDDMPDVATAFLADGWDTDDVAAAAMPDSRDPRDVRDLFLRALESLGVAVPPWETAVRPWLIDLARRRASGELTREQAAAQFHETVTSADLDRLGDPASPTSHGRPASTTTTHRAGRTCSTTPSDGAANYLRQAGEWSATANAVPTEALTPHRTG